ncbi:putative 2,4-dienoyl-coa reductase-like protein [Trypanosoma rangeli]|uniref:Putative 2,4-dienoyl-coa reductase-like protein n=1 Tax=Trypanosoma rangeli TaxID=5698 RepID=A0A422N305_TRYRA|nr:putative 2,4-dienoyl-coa reductase-like protein [Trypanosoma rangeli]RNE99845.1 putative 2,4-dienoyl-coa reductase-like protein [Trypanosoma rangeli]|eukprot:RNE99845.1 putative 2,4-dienoyl-coa reductase-like protein [Trypanosoma rangeli]
MSDAGRDTPDAKDLVDRLDVLSFYSSHFHAITFPLRCGGGKQAVAYNSSSSSWRNNFDPTARGRDAGWLTFSTQLEAGTEEGAPAVPLPPCIAGCSCKALQPPRCLFPGFAATLHRSNSVDSFGRVIRRHSISPSQPGLQVKILEDDKEEHHLELATPMQHTPRGSLKLALVSRNCRNGEDNDALGSWHGAGTNPAVESSRLHSVRFILPSTTTRRRSFRDAGETLPSDPSMSTFRQLSGNERGEHDRLHTSHMDAVEAQARSARETKIKLSLIPLVEKRKGVADKRGGAGSPLPRHEKPHNDKSIGNGSMKGKDKPSQGRFFSRLFCMS